jgi:hypothetical protein
VGEVKRGALVENCCHNIVFNEIFFWGREDEDKRRQKE